MISIEVGPVPSAEIPSVNPVRALIEASAFLHQLQRQRPLLEESGLGYCIQTGLRPACYRVVIAGQAGSFAKADLALSLAASAQEVSHWDEQALLDLGRSTQQSQVDQQVLKSA